MTIAFKSLPMEIKANTNGNLVFKISTKMTDRDEDVLEPMGCDLTNYRNNPVVLFAHDYGSPPIGRSLRESIYPEYIESEVEFAPTAFAQDCKKLCEGGFLNAASVGFRGIESDPIPESRWGKHFKKWELLEWSVVPVPSNAASLIQGAKAKGINLDAMEKELNQMGNKSIEVDEKLKMLKVFDDEGNEKLITFEVLKSLDVNRIKTLEGHSEKVATLTDYLVENGIGEPGEDAVEVAIKAIGEKAGATLSKKSKEMLNKVCDGMKESGDKLRKFIDGAGMMEEDPMMTAEMTMPMMDPMMSAMRTAIADELKQALDEMKSQVSLLLQKDAPKVIDLDAIEFPKAKENPDQIQLNIEPEELKRLIREATQNLIQGGN